MYLKSFLAIAAIALLSTGCSNMTPERHMAGYESVVLKQKNIAILPAEVYVETVDYFGAKERMHDYEYHLEKMIDREMLPAIQEKGFKAKRLSRKDIHNKKLNKLVGELRARYGEKRAIVYDKYLWNEKEAFDLSQNIGTIAVELGEAVKSDLLVFVDFVASSKTQGAQTAEVVTSLLLGALSGKARYNNEPSEEAVMVIAIIDAKTGNILWSNKGITGALNVDGALASFEKDDTAGSTEIKRLIRAILDSFNKPRKK